MRVLVALVCLPAMIVSGFALLFDVPRYLAGNPPAGHMSVHITAVDVAVAGGVFFGSILGLAYVSDPEGAAEVYRRLRGRKR